MEALEAAAVLTKRKGDIHRKLLSPSDTDDKKLLNREISAIDVALVYLMLIIDGHYTPKEKSKRELTNEIQPPSPRPGIRSGIPSNVAP